MSDGNFSKTGEQGGPQTDAPEGTARAVEAALSLAAAGGWRQVTFAAIARESGLDLAELYRHFPGRGALLAAVSRQADRAMLEAAGDDAGDTPRERLFSLLMARFDALSPYKAGLAAVARDLALEPLLWPGGAWRLERSMAWALEAAGISAAGIAGAVRVRVMAALYVSVARVWLGDESVDQGRTMASLDRALSRAESWAQSISKSGLGLKRDTAAGALETGGDPARL